MVGSTNGGATAGLGQTKPPSRIQSPHTYRRKASSCNMKPFRRNLSRGAIASCSRRERQIGRCTPKVSFDCMLSSSLADPFRLCGSFKRTARNLNVMWQVGYNIRTLSNKVRVVAFCCAAVDLLTTTSATSRSMARLWSPWWAASTHALLLMVTTLSPSLILCRSVPVGVVI